MFQQIIYVHTENMLLYIRICAKIKLKLVKQNSCMCKSKFILKLSYKVPQ